VPATESGFFLRSIVYPTMNLAETTWRELKRLQTTLVMRFVLEGEIAAQDFADHVALLKRLRVSAGGLEDAEDEGNDVDLEQAAGAMPHSNAFGPVDGGDDEVNVLFGENSKKSKQASFVSWVVGKVQGGDFELA